MTPDGSTLILLGLVFGALVLLARALVDWRRLAAAAGVNPPVWAFLERQGVRRETISESSQRIAGMRCAACASRRDCAARLAGGLVSPVADCPNATLFSPPRA
jgi:hypothetical protein